MASREKPALHHIGIDVVIDMAALHTSKTLDEMGQLQLRMAKLEADVARLNKGYRVKGSGSQKEFVTGSGKSFRSSKI